MSLKEKAQLVIGTGMYFQLPDSVLERFGGPREIDPNDSVYSAMVEKIREFVPGAAGNTSMFEQHGITTQVLADGPAGLRIQPKRKGEDKTYYCTAFPIGTVMASTWDTELVYKVGQAMGKEVLEYGVDVLLAPALNLQRDPLCGRNFEYYSEDPLVSGKMTAAMVKGVQSNGVGTSIKHYAANNQETNRLSVNTIVSERALRELYLKGFEIAVKEAQPWTVMSAYNKINGQYASESHDLLTKILRDDWGFKGYVMTDWGAGSDLVAQMEAGNDMIQPGSPKQVYELIELVENGKLDETVLDLNVSRILKVMLKTPKYKGYEYSGNPNLEVHALVTRQAATDGMVLLENNGALPFSENIEKVAAFGNCSYDFISGGTGSGDVNEAYTISLIQGLENGEYKAHIGLGKIYDEYMVEARANAPKSDNWLTNLMGGKVPVAEMAVSKELAAQMATENDIALITIGRNSGEGGDRKPEPCDFYLTDVEKEMIANVTEAFHAEGKKTVVVLNVGGVIETASWKNTPDAVLLAWQPGQEAGNSVVDVLSGKVNPSGKLAITFPVKYADVPSANTFPGHAVEGETGDEKDMSGFSFMRRVPWEVVYEEDIYVGYRYYNTFDVGVSYPFGYGKSYTDFEYTDVVLSARKFRKKIKVSVTVENAGDVAGREVVQVYLSAPGKSMDKPEMELVGFDKTDVLIPGEAEIITFTLEPIDLCSFDGARSSWIAEPGEYTVKVAASANDIRGAKTFTLQEEMVVETVTKALAPEVEISKLTK
ncbi:MAG: glycoside hydrolase family 3 C-terminal domain-containing protein [Prolixibacteraceae bacterium]|nr:glycoside hydrolase family 3 C-terminal domain-containing protein [Prolixibacteraceae bacterium]